MHKSAFFVALGSHIEVHKKNPVPIQFAFASGGAVSILFSDKKFEASLHNTANWKSRISWSWDLFIFPNEIKLAGVPLQTILHAKSALKIKFLSLTKIWKICGPTINEGNYCSKRTSSLEITRWSKIQNRFSPFVLMASCQSCPDSLLIILLLLNKTIESRASNQLSVKTRHPIRCKFCLKMHADFKNRSRFSCIGGNNKI